MKGSPSFIKSLTDLIKQDDVRGSLEKVESKRRGTDFDLKCATKCLIELQLLLGKGLNEGQDVVSSTKDIFEMAKNCLDTIEQSNWDISNSRFLTCAFYLTKFFLSKDELSLGKDVCSALKRWNAHNTELNNSEKNILVQICYTLNSYLYDIDLEKCLEVGSANIQLLFDSCTIPCDLQICNEAILKYSLLTFRSLIHKINSLNVELNDCIHIESVKCVMRNFAKSGNSVVNISATFMNCLDVLMACIVYTAKKENYQELSHLLELIDVSKNLFSHKNCHSCLDVCRNFISLVLIDQGIVEENVINLCTYSSNLLEKLSSRNDELLPCLLKFLFNTVKSFSLEFKNHSSTYPKFLSLMLAACKIQKTLLDASCVKNVKTDDLSVFIAFVNLILSKMIKLPKELNESEVFLLSIFESLEKLTDYTVELLVYDHNCECSFKDNCSSVLGRISVLIHSYYTANMFDNALTLTLNLIEKLVYLSCDDSCHVSPTTKRFLYSVLLQCSKKTDKIEVSVNVILASICKDQSSSDELFRQLATLKNCIKCSEVDKCSTFFELLDKRRTLLVNKWNIPLSVMDDVKRTPIILSEMKAYCKMLSPKGELMLKVVKNLLASNPSLLDAAKGMVLVLDVSTRTYIDVGKLDKERLKIQENLRKQVIESRDFESLLLLGSLLHYSTLFKIYAIRKKIQVQTVGWKAQEEPPTLNETGMFSEPHESCGPIAASELAFTNQQPLLDELEKSFNYLKAAFGKLEGDCNDLDTYVEISYSNIKLTAQLYTLYRFEEKAIDAWTLLYRLGERFSHQSMRISAVANLLKLEAKFDKMWIDNAMEIAISLPDISSDRQLFYICLASSCMKSSQISDAVSHLTKVGDKFRNEKIRTLFLLTLGQVLLVPESTALWKGTPSSAIYAFDKAFRHLYHLINNDNWEGFIDHCTLAETFLDTLMCLKRFSSSIMMPRLAYYYLNEQSAVVQKLAVPLRLAELLISSAWVDVSVHKKDDCDLKLANIIAILGLQKIAHVIGDSARSPSRKGLAFGDEPNSACPLTPPDDKLRELMAAPKNVSPVMCRKEWSQIVVHPADCPCLSCRTPTFTRLTFDVLLLQAASYCIRRQFGQAVKYYDDALNYLEILGGKGINDEWIGGRRVVLYYFYNEMLISCKNFKAAESGVRKIVKQGLVALPTETYGVTADHIELQKDNLIFLNLKNRLERKVEKPKPSTKHRLAVPSSTSAFTHGAANEIITPAKSSAVPSHLPPSPSNGTANKPAPAHDKRNMLISAKALDFSSEDEVEVVDETFTEKENNFVISVMTKQRLRRNQLPSIVTSVPKVAKLALPKVANKKTDSGKEKVSSRVPVRKKDNSKDKIPSVGNDSSKDKKSKSKSNFEICNDPPQSSSKTNRPVRASRKK